MNWESDTQNARRGIFPQPLVDIRLASEGRGKVRVLLTAAAYVLLQELRLQAAHTNCARAQVWTLRERLLKLGAQVLGSVRRVVVHLPSSFPFLPAFRQVALALGASTG